jgi:hypothetical protein
LNPRLQDRDLIGIQGVFGGHLQRAAAANRLDQKTTVGIARLDSRPMITSFAEGLGRIEAQAHLLLFGPVASSTMIQEQWSYAFFHKLELFP